MLSKKLRKRAFQGGDKRRGAVFVEFGLFFLLFLTLSVALMELGLGIWTYTNLSHAARAGGRYAMIRGASNPIGDGDTTIEDVVRANAIGLVRRDLTVKASYDSTNEKGNIVEIRVEYPYNLVTNGLFLDKGTIKLASTTRMVIMN